VLQLQKLELVPVSGSQQAPLWNEGVIVVVVSCCYWLPCECVLVAQPSVDGAATYPACDSTFEAISQSGGNIATF
jgi:hypothetical protein